MTTTRLLFLKKKLITHNEEKEKVSARIAENKVLRDADETLPEYKDADASILEMTDSEVLDGLSIAIEKELAEILECEKVLEGNPSIPEIVQVESSQCFRAVWSIIQTKLASFLENVRLI